MHLRPILEPEATGALAEMLSEIREDRRARARAIVRRFNELGVPLEWSAVARESVGDVPTRAHVARAIVDSGLMADVQEVFVRYLGDGGPACVEKAVVEPQVVFDAVHDAGGVVILAHPGHAFDDDRIVEWARQGLDGIEVMHPKNRGQRRDELRALAYRLDLLSTGGSDWHGTRGGGMEPGAERVPLEWMEAIAARCGASLDPTQKPPMEVE